MTGLLTDAFGGINDVRGTRRPGLKGRVDAGVTVGPAGVDGVAARTSGGVTRGLGAAFGLAFGVTRGLVTGGGSGAAGSGSGAAATRAGSAAIRRAQSTYVRRLNVGLPAVCSLFRWTDAARLRAVGGRC